MYVKDAPFFFRVLRTKSIVSFLTSSISSILKDLKEILYVTIATILPLVQIIGFCKVTRILREELIYQVLCITYTDLDSPYHFERRNSSWRNTTIDQAK